MNDLSNKIITSLLLRNSKYLNNLPLVFHGQQVWHAISPTELLLYSYLLLNHLPLFYERKKINEEH